MMGKKEGDFYVKSVSENEKEVQLNNKYTINSENKYFEVIPFVINLIN